MTAQMIYTVIFIHPTAGSSVRRMTLPTGLHRARQVFAKHHPSFKVIAIIPGSHPTDLDIKGDINEYSSANAC